MMLLGGKLDQEIPEDELHSISGRIVDDLGDAEDRIRPVNKFSASF